MTKKKEQVEQVVVSYKGFSPDWKCRDFQYEIGKTYEHKGKVEACAGGFHACEYPLHVLRYYKPSQSKFAVVEQSGTISRHDEDSKIASSRITVKAELDIAGLIKAAVKYTLDLCTPAEGAISDQPNTVVKAEGKNKSALASGYYGAATASGYYGAATASGDYGAATASGNSGAATASGDYGAATASGYSGAATASGDYGAATASGDSGAATASGDSGAATASGDYGAATASGDYGAATASGDYGAATASGDYSAATASGYSGAATASGNSGAATASGDYGAATASGDYGAATASGRNGKAKGKDGCALFLIYRDDSWKIVHAKAAIVGQNGIKADTFYRLNAAGEFVEV
ncbi:DUF7666 domain-containing protein [Ralstonia insidiosa]|uniref:DUF7666 domain-containing protein n=1 Tax=Ralstonia insidiosa TaxID=190721 RepID=UPI001ABFDA07|nr:hypothetical protein [Ralstonia insidiosa]